jgi:preprotein translocase subunit SecD
VDQNEPLYYAAIDPCSYVPLVIEGKPQVQKDGRGKGVLLVSLERKNAKKLEDFTRAYFGGRVATIVDGEIVSMNKIRAVIVNGKFQMTR